MLVGGAEAIVFTGGIGEYSVGIREEIIKGVESLGFKMDAEKNAAHFGKKGIVSTDDSKGKVIIMPTNEELMIAKSTVQVLKLA